MGTTINLPKINKYKKIQFSSTNSTLQKERTRIHYMITLIATRDTCKNLILKQFIIKNNMDIDLLIQIFFSQLGKTMYFNIAINPTFDDKNRSHQTCF